MIKLINLLKELQEYGNQGPSTPEVYILDILNKQVVPSSMKEVQKISNLIYDMGGGETSLYDEFNVVIVDNMDENEVLEGLSEGKQKLYIKYNLENSISLPKANKIIASQIVYHLSNIENFAKTVNDSLKPNGILDFFSDIMSKEDKQFVKILVEKYGFFLPDDVSLKSLSKNKYKNLLLRRNKPYVTPKKKEFVPQELVYDITTKEGNARVQYTKLKFPNEGSVYTTKKLSGTIPDRYFLYDRKSYKKGRKPDYIGAIFHSKNIIPGADGLDIKPWDPEDGPYPYYQALDDKNKWKYIPWDIISFKRVK
jgi:hypothetical protein